MPKITDTPPQYVQNDLDFLKKALNKTIPAKKKGKNLLIATWNIRAFSSLTRRWTSKKGDSPKRDLRGLRTIIDIIKRFDVIAIQEVQGDLRALRDMMDYLGDGWAFLMTDITLGDAGNNERIAFVFNRKRVQPSGLACELVVPPEQLAELDEDSLKRQFVRTPYAVSFRSGEATFILVTLHIYYQKEGESDDQAIAKRKKELKSIARWMREWAKRETRYHHNLITLGDFNIKEHGGELWEAFTSTGLTVPKDLIPIKHTIFNDADDPTTEGFYDQIAWFTEASGKISLNMKYVKAGSFDFMPHAYKGLGLSAMSTSYRISDHYPLWVEFDIS